MGDQLVSVLALLDGSVSFFAFPNKPFLWVEKKIMELYAYNGRILWHINYNLIKLLKLRKKGLGG